MFLIIPVESKIVNYEIDTRKKEVNNHSLYLCCEFISRVKGHLKTFNGHIQSLCPFNGHIQSLSPFNGHIYSLSPFNGHISRVCLPLMVIFRVYFRFMDTPRVYLPFMVTSRVVSLEWSHLELSPSNGRTQSLSPFNAHTWSCLPLMVTHLELSL